MLYKLFQWIFHKTPQTNNRNLTWRSITGQTFNVTELGDGHLCNIYYYNKFITGIPTPNSIMIEINRRFGSIEHILLYEPVIEYEIKKLKGDGLLKFVKGKGYEIWFQNKYTGLVGMKTINNLAGIRIMYEEDMMIHDNKEKAENFKETIIL